MTRRIFKGITPGRLTDGEVDSIRKSGIIDEIIERYYEFVDAEAMIKEEEE